MAPIGYYVLTTLEANVDRKIRKALTENLAVSVSTASKALGTGEYATYTGIKSGDIPSIKVGRRIMVPTAPLMKMLGLDSEDPKAA
jgi:hypothetical protein